MTATRELFGVTGATGAVGGLVARLLAERGVAQRLVVRAGSDVADLPPAEAREITDYGDHTSMRAALEGMTAVFLVSGREHPDRLRQHKTAVDAAVDAGVERIVYLSFLGAASDATFTLARQHFATEEHIRSHGVAFTFLRSSLYLDFVPWVASPNGVIAGPAGDGRLAPVARADVAEAVVAVLTSRDHDGRCYDNTGPYTISLQEAADELARASGRAVIYKDETLEEAWESRRPTGAPEWEIEGWITSYLAIATGELDVVSDTVPRLTGHRAQSLPEYLDAHPESYAHLK
ncbi:MAG: SDR family oxidoreductase [Actinomycetota bacterium]|nr:SDR family oxidoreductase [Actinomycetota bacterium]